MSQAGNKFRRALGRHLRLILPFLLVSGAMGEVVRFGNVAEEFQERVWTREDGLPDTRVQALLQTHRDGYLWVGTRAGLARFDGLRFVVFNHVNVLAMTNDDVTALAEDVDGSLWAGTANGLLHRGLDSAFTNYTTREGLCDDAVLRLCVSHSGGVWVGTDRGLNRVRNGKVERFTVKDGLLTDRIRGLFEDSDGTLWVGMDFDWLRHWPLLMQTRSPEGRAFRDFPRPPQVGGVMADIIVRGAEGDLWLLGGVLGQLKSPREGAAFAGPLYGRPDFLLPDRAGNVWLSWWLPVGTAGVDRFRDGSFTRYEVAPGVAYNAVRCMIEDREGNLWIGDERSGLHRWRPRTIRTWTKEQGLAAEDVWTICPGRDGCVWIGTGGGVSQWSEGRFRNYTTNEGLVHNAVRALSEDATYRLWIGTIRGLDALREGKLTHHRFSHIRLPGDNDGLIANKIRGVLPARDGSLWVAAAYGLHHLHEGQDTLYTRQDGLPHDDVRALLQTRDGSLWFGTAGGGLAYLSGAEVELLAPPTNAIPRSPVAPPASPARSDGLPSSDTRRRIHFRTFTTADGLCSNNAWALYEDAEQVLWIGTEKGLNRFKDGRLGTLAAAQGLPEQSVNSILADDLGNLWIGGARGIYRAPLRELNEVVEGKRVRVQCVGYDATDGLLCAETSGQHSSPAACRSWDGRLWFATPKGVVVIDPKQTIERDTPPGVVIETVRANGQLLFDNANAAPRGTGVSPVLPATPPPSPLTARQSPRQPNPLLPLRLAPGSAQVLEITYTATTLIAADKAQFRFRLQGLDDHWVEAGTRRAANFTALSPGQYKFTVTACDHRGFWNEQGTSWAFYLAPHYYQTKSFYGACVVSLAALALAIHRRRVRAVRKVHALQQQAVVLQERTRIARDIHDEVGAILNQIELRTELARRDVGPEQPAIKTPDVTATVREAGQALDEIVWAVSPENDTLLSLLGYLRSHLTEYLALAGLRANLDWPDTVPDLALSATARHNLFLVLNEALHNTVQHAQAREVSVRIEVDGATLKVHYADDGRGFDVEAARRRGDGNGLGNMEQRITDLGGRFHLESQPGQGTRIEVNLQLDGLN